MEYSEYKTRKDAGMAAITMLNAEKVVQYKSFDPITGEKTVTDTESLGEATLRYIQDDITKCQQEITNLQSRIDSETELITDWNA